MGEHRRLNEAVNLLKCLISTPSFSREEEATADIWEKWLREQGAQNVVRQHNNVFAVGSSYDPFRPTLMLNSHHDTVKPSPSYTRNPFSPDIEDGKLYGLGSNDAGASGVALASAFLEMKDRTDLPFNLIFAITAAEEVMGEKGMRAFLPYLEQLGMLPDMVIVGEPTGMRPAIAERGLLVFDAETEGKPGHAARNEGINAIYRAMEDIETLRNFSTPIVSDVLGPIKVSVTMISAGTQHNVVPDKCKWVVDVRTTDAYTNVETVELIREAVKWSRLTPRSTRVQASVISSEHPLVKASESLGLEAFISPTTSDMALMHGIPSLKIGPGESSRSHTADEYVEISEINEALHLYPRLIEAAGGFIELERPQIGSML
ncbi:MAG: M20/M25/M40 family metallo-hydrolase [Muribaculaceae bacterium]|nr:M20/M25/M40 family metallo-hydrolase [Muribaculaceae bacterium]